MDFYGTATHTFRLCAAYSILFVGGPWGLTGWRCPLPQFTPQFIRTAKLTNMLLKAVLLQSFFFHKNTNSVAASGNRTCRFWEDSAVYLLKCIKMLLNIVNIGFVKRKPLMKSKGIKNLPKKLRALHSTQQKETLRIRRSQRSRRTALYFLDNPYCTNYQEV